MLYYFAVKKGQKWAKMCIKRQKTPLSLTFIKVRIFFIHLIKSKSSLNYLSHYVQFHKILRPFSGEPLVLS